MHRMPLSCSPLVPGRAVHGIVVNEPPAAPGPYPYILVTRKLTVRDLSALRRCAMVISESNGAEDHPAVICRIKGKALVLIANACSLVRAGDLVTYDPASARVWWGLRPIPSQVRSEAEAKMRVELCARNARFQVSIVDEEDVAIVNQVADDGLQVDRFFFRAEFLWQRESIDPFRHVRRHGVEGTVELLEDRLRAILTLLRPGQVLNFRSLDLRSDETPEPNPDAVEPNPQLGDHGIRRSLREPEILTAEILTASRLAAEGFTNLEISIPFVTLAEEVGQVLEHASRTSQARLNWSVFVETPAAVLELPHILGHPIHHCYIGTKDLTQLILACDRGNRIVGSLYDPTRRPVLATIRRAIEECEARGVPATLFASLKDLGRMLVEFPDHRRFSICRSDYEWLSSPGSGLRDMAHTR